jgi:hypothetical protein
MHVQFTFLLLLKQSVQNFIFEFKSKVEQLGKSLISYKLQKYTTRDIAIRVRTVCILLVCVRESYINNLGQTTYMYVQVQGFVKYHVVYSYSKYHTMLY